MKASFNIYIYLLALLMLFSCSHYLVNNAGYIRPPKNKKFPYKKRFEKLNDLSIIDTTVIYYLSNSYYYKDSTKYKNDDAYIRFYGDGHFKLQGLKQYPAIEEVNNPNKGIVGYYYTEDKVVKMQVYTDIGAGSLQLDFGYIDENKNLIVMHDNPAFDYSIGYTEKKIRRLIKKSIYSPKIYKKTHITGIKYIKPNW